MEQRFNDHEIRIRDLERKAIELGYSIHTNGKLLENLIPKVDKLVSSDTLATEIKNALRTNEKELWTKREKYMAVWTLLVTTVAPIATTLIVVYHSGK